MAEILVKIPTCSKCGEEARNQALYCFACGGKILDPLIDETEGDVSSAWFRGDIVKDASSEKESSTVSESDESEESAESEESEQHEKSGAAEKTEIDLDDSEDSHDDQKKKESDKTHNPQNKQEQTAIEETNKGKLTSAAEIRRKPKPVRTKRVEVVWKASGSGPNPAFLIFGLLLALIAAVMFFLAMYLK